jgi:hypothetical protein
MQASVLDRPAHRLGQRVERDQDIVDGAKLVRFVEFERAAHNRAHDRQLIE